eukprot:13399749-Alexandrium_andersonii.AAC.1
MAAGAEVVCAWIPVFKFYSMKVFARASYDAFADRLVIDDLLSFSTASQALKSAHDLLCKPNSSVTLE